MDKITEDFADFIRVRPRKPRKEFPFHQETEMRNGRKVTKATAWWIDNQPKAYTYYCTHGVKLSDPCKRCNP